jgi:glycosyltransferase involved in cell wall biosynthesis
MRIGLFADMYTPHISGVTNHVALYKRHFERRGHEVLVFTFGDTDFADAEMGVIRSPGLAWGRTGWKLATGFSAQARRLAETLDIAHVHHPFESGRLLAPLARRCDIPVVFTNHTRYDLYSDAYARLVPQAARYGYLRRSLRDFAGRCGLVVAPSASIAEWLAEFAHVPDAEVIPNGIDVAAFARPTRPVTREELGFSADDVVFCYAGRLGPEKSTAFLAEEFARTCTDAPNARLLVIGDGPARAAAEAALAAAGVSERARFLGMVPYDRVPDFEAAADAFVTASTSEVHPLVVLEAMAAGLPVVAISSPGISDTVANGESGLLARDATIGALAERMGALATDVRLRARLSAGARAAADAYSLPNTADVLLRRYEELRAGRASG